MREVSPQSILNTLPKKEKNKEQKNLFSARVAIEKQLEAEKKTC